MTTRAAQIECLLAPIIDYRDSSIASGYTVYFYSAGTSNAKNVWTEKEKTNPYTSRTIGSDGTVQVYGDGVYRIIIKDDDSTTVYDWDNIKIQANTYTAQVKSAAYTATADDDLIVCNGTFTVDIDDIANFTHPLIIKRIGGTITVDAYSTQKIDDALTITLTASDDNAILYPDTISSVWRRANRFSGLTASVTELNKLYGLSGDILTDINSKTVSNKIFSQDGPLAISDTGEGPTENPIKALAPNIGDGHTASIIIGKAATAKNSFLLNYYHVGAASTSNYLSIKSYSLDDIIRFIGTYDVTLPTADLTITAGDQTITAGDLTITAGDLIITAGNLSMGGVTQPQRKIISIGDWNMDSQSTTQIAHGLTFANIRSITGLIRNDNNSIWHPIGPDDTAGDVYINQVDSTNVVLNRVASGTYDSVHYDSTSYNRGYLIIDHDPS